MLQNNFFEIKGPFTLKELFPNQKIDFKLKDIKPLNTAQNSDITFLDSTRYKDQASNTKASCCITTEKLKEYLPDTCKPIIVKSVLFDLAKIVKKFYPYADIDYPDQSLKEPNTSDFPDVKFGNNVLIGKNVKIGKNSKIGSFTIIEQNVLIGKDCVINSHVMIKNSIIGNEVIIQDGCKIGLKGFGFIPLKDKNLKFPHIGKVIIKDNVELASSCTIDRGSIDDTVIGENTYLDNQVHVAHNVKMGKNCMIAGQVGFAGSTTIGDNVSIGGQAGISGHLKIGNNVKIGGGSGVIKDIEDNSIVMGYPAIPFKNFIKNWKK
jgi:UDP-3-O-[3-hydroxymyristoyl] glucosamine N-acyltransferase|tara:strand:- start:748 stop:1710 length:963 start_codon:yes stop_codon:yes gene_type:complete